MSSFPVFDPATPKVSTLSIGKGVLESAIELVADATQQAAKFQPQAELKAAFMLNAYVASSSTKCILTNATGVRLQFFEAGSKGILPEYKPPSILEPVARLRPSWSTRTSDSSSSTTSKPSRAPWLAG